MSLLGRIGKALGREEKPSEEEKKIVARFGPAALQAFKSEERDLSTLLQYDRRFGLEDVKRFLYSVGAAPELVNRFDPRFNANAITELCKGKVPPEIANSYDTRLEGEEIAHVYGEGFPLELTKQYDQRFQPIDVANLALNKVDPKIANAFRPGIDGRHIMHMCEDGISPEVFNSYDDYFFARADQEEECMQIVVLHAVGISPEVAKRFVVVGRKHFTRIEAYKIVDYVLLGITPEKLDERLKSKKGYISEVHAGLMLTFFSSKK